jgi:hypothetical protein
MFALLTTLMGDRVYPLGILIRCLGVQERKGKGRPYLDALDKQHCS